MRKSALVSHGTRWSLHKGVSVARAGWLGAALCAACNSSTATTERSTSMVRAAPERAAAGRIVRLNGPVVFSVPPEARSLDDLPVVEGKQYGVFRDDKEDRSLQYVEIVTNIYRRAQEGDRAPGFLWIYYHVTAPETYNGFWLKLGGADWSAYADGEVVLRLCRMPPMNRVAVEDAHGALLQDSACTDEMKIELKGLESDGTVAKGEARVRLGKSTQWKESKDEGCHEVRIALQKFNVRRLLRSMSELCIVFENGALAPSMRRGNLGLHAVVLTRKKGEPVDGLLADSGWKCRPRPAVTSAAKPPPATRAAKPADAAAGTSKPASRPVATRPSAPQPGAASPDAAGPSAGQNPMTPIAPDKCPICGSRNALVDTFDCQRCGRKYLCKSHLVAGERCCETCAAKAGEETPVETKKQGADQIPAAAQEQAPKKTPIAARERLLFAPNSRGELRSSIFCQDCVVSEKAVEVQLPDKSRVAVQRIAYNVPRGFGGWVVNLKGEDWSAFEGGDLVIRVGAAAKSPRQLTVELKTPNKECQYPVTVDIGSDKKKAGDKNGFLDLVLPLPSFQVPALSPMAELAVVFDALYLDENARQGTVDIHSIRLVPPAAPRAAPR